MIILDCPQCSEPVTASAGLRPASRVRCPMCQAEYSLADALGTLPPALISLDEPVTSGADGEELQLEPTWESRGEGQLAAAAAVSFGAAGAPKTLGAGPRLVTRPRPKRKPKNPIVEVVKVVGGGVAGLFIAVLVLWWFPVDRFRRDPLELGPKVAAIRWLRFIVPPNFRPVDISDGVEDVDAEPAKGFRAPINKRSNAQSTTDNSSGTTNLGSKVDWNEVIRSKQADDDDASLRAKKGVRKADLILDDPFDNPASPSKDPVDLKIELKDTLDKPTPKQTKPVVDPEPAPPPGAAPKSEAAKEPAPPADSASPNK